VRLDDFSLECFKSHALLIRIFNHFLGQLLDLLHNVIVLILFLRVNTILKLLSSLYGLLYEEF
jgi:hypothetical protein